MQCWVRQRPTGSCFLHPDNCTLVHARRTCLRRAARSSMLCSVSSRAVDFSSANLSTLVGPSAYTETYTCNHTEASSLMTDRVPLWHNLACTARSAAPKQPTDGLWHAESDSWAPHEMGSCSSVNTKQGTFLENSAANREVRRCLTSSGMSGMLSCSVWKRLMLPLLPGVDSVLGRCKADCTPRRSRL